MADKVRMINAEKLKKQIIEGDGHDDDRFTEGYNFAINEIRGYIDDMPTVEAEPVKHGHWIRGKNKSAFPAKPSPIWYCSCCGEMIRYNDSTCVYQKKKKKVNEVNPRCRRCGARMDGDGE